MNYLLAFFQKPIFSDKRFIFSVWFGITLISALKHALKGLNNNYLIYKYTFYNTIDQINLYAEYPERYFDKNHYGPIFSLIIAPFALLPDGFGTTLWELSMSAVLLFAIYKLPITWKGKVIIYWITMHEIYSNAANSQSNTLIAALIIGSFICIRAEKDFWAACFISLGLFIKIYGIVGLAFFFFSRHRVKLILYVILWSIVFFVLPMLISSPEFIIQTYADWYNAIMGKNMSNSQAIYQNISVMGLVKKSLGYFDFSDLIIIVPALLLFGLQYIQIKYYNDLRYQLGILASTLMFLVLFSTGSEMCTYVIAASGVGIWFILQQKPRSNYVIFLLILIILSYVSSSDISPAFWKKEIFRPFALKALPFLMVWLTLVYQLIGFNKTAQTSLSNEYLESES